MPGRFSNLEFREDRRDQTEASPALQQRQSRADTAADLMTLADMEYHWGHFEPALRLYTRALKEQRTLIPAWVGQVQMLVQLDECHEARLWSDKGLELFHNNGELLAAKSQASARLKDTRAAMSSSDASMSSPGSSPWRWIARGEALLAGRHKLATECFQKAIAEPASTWFDEVVIAQIYLYYYRAANALAHIKRAVELEPTHGYPWLVMGHCQAVLGMCPAAEESYERCLALRADCDEATQALAALSSGNRLLPHLSRFLFGWMRR